MARLANAQVCPSDPQRPVAGNDDARLAPQVVVEVQAVGAAQILGDERPVGSAGHAQVLRGDVGIVDDHVVVVGAADADVVALAAVARDDVAVPRQDFDPDHFAAADLPLPESDHPTDPRNCLPSATALS